MARRSGRRNPRASRPARSETADRDNRPRARVDEETPKFSGEQEEGRYRGRHREDDRTWTPWLLIRYKDPDLGARTIPDGEVFWASPDIWVETADPFGNPIAGVPTFLHAQIINLGKAPAYPMRVDFYWGHPSPSFGPGNMKHIGTEWVEVDARQVKDVRCGTAWTPVRVDDGHECLMVNSTSPIHDWNKLAQRFPFQPKLDRRTGQRNVTVLAAEPGATLAVTLGVNNLFPMTATATVRARLAHVAVDRQAAEGLSRRDLVNRLAAYGGPATRDPLVVDVTQGELGSRSAPRISANVEDGSRVAPYPEARTYLANILAADRPAPPGTASGAGLHATLVSLSMEAFEQRRMQLECGVPAHARPGEFVVYQVAQRLEGFTVGGYTIVVGVR